VVLDMQVLLQVLRPIMQVGVVEVEQLVAVLVEQAETVVVEQAELVL